MPGSISQQILWRVYRAVLLSLDPDRELPETWEELPDDQRRAIYGLAMCCHRLAGSPPPPEPETIYTWPEINAINDCVTAVFREAGIIP